MNNQIDKLHQGLDAIRIQAEIETADRSQTKRPTWAPAVVLDGELLELCRELEYLTPDDKPVARLWAAFADPKRKGAVIRATYSQHLLPDIRCRGFELRAGTQHNGERMTQALMRADGSWSVGGIGWGHSDISRMRHFASTCAARIEQIERQLQPSDPPRQTSPEQIYTWSIERGDSAEEAHRKREFMRKSNAEALARWEAREREKQDPIFIERMHELKAASRVQLERQRREIAKEEANPDWRYKARTRMTELATQRVLIFAGDAQGKRQRGAAVTGACYCCGKTLTDKISVERGIGPECIKYLRTFDLTDLVRLKNEMVAAHPDKGGRHEIFLEAYARYAAVKATAEQSLTY